MPTRRSLARDEARLWAAVAQTVEPLPGKRAPIIADPPAPTAGKKVAVRVARAVSTPPAKPPPNALLFVASDSVFAINRFKGPLPGAGLAAMLAYVLAAYAIIVGVRGSAVAAQRWAFTNRAITNRG